MDIRLLQLGRENNTVLSNLALLLSRVQSEYDFIFNDDIIDIDHLTPSANGQYPTRLLEECMTEYMNKKGLKEYPVGVTDLPLEDLLVYSANSEIALLSSYEWKTFSKTPLIKGLEYLIAGVLIDIHDVTTVHYDTKGCPNDYCEVRDEINEGIAKSELCHQCRTDILSAIEKGDMTPSEAVAVYRILDDVAGRKICFVLMPFREEFTVPYEAMRAILEGAGYTVRRADEIFETRSIIQLVYEQIGRADLIIADLTDRNPNVFYELGYAHALGKSTVLVTQNESDVPFDLRHRQYVLYDPEKLDGSLASKIKSYLP